MPTSYYVGFSEAVASSLIQNPEGSLKFTQNTFTSAQYASSPAAFASFLSLGLSTPVPLVYSAISISNAGVAHKGKAPFTSLVTCNDTAAVKTIINGLKKGIDVDMSCNGARWLYKDQSVFAGSLSSSTSASAFASSPTNSRFTDAQFYERVHSRSFTQVAAVGTPRAPKKVLCVGCSTGTGKCYSSDAHTIVLGSSLLCGAGVKYTKATTLMGVTQSALAPPTVPVTNYVVLSAEKNNITATVNVTAFAPGGTLYCAAFISAKLPASGLASVGDVKNSPSVVTSSFSLTQTSTFVEFITIKKLVAASTYTVFCYAEDSIGNGQNKADVIALNQTITTACCRSVSMTNTPAYIYDSASSLKGVNPLQITFSFSLGSAPSQTLILTPLFFAASGTWSTANPLPISTIAANPANFSFTSTSIAVTGSFRISADAGSYR